MSISAINKLSAILEGWKNYAFKSPEIEKMAKQRAEICSNCDYADPEHPIRALVMPEKAIAEIKGMACTLCGCPLSTKLRVPFERCPDKKW